MPNVKLVKNAGEFFAQQLGQSQATRFFKLGEITEDSGIINRHKDEIFFDSWDDLEATLAGAIRKQPDGCSGALCHEGYANIFYVHTQDTMRCVCASWSQGRQWCINVDPLGSWWFPGNRIFLPC